MEHYEEFKDKLIKERMIVHEEENCFCVHLKGNYGLHVIEVSPTENGCINSFIYHYMDIPTEVKPKVLEYINEVNQGLSIGAMYTDSDSICFRYLLESPTNVEDTASTIIGYGFNALDTYTSGLLQVTYANVSPKEAYEQANLEMTARFTNGKDIAES